jgi:Kef-type K+ transport system membrane component KefB
MELEFTNLLAVTVIGFLAPLTLGLAPRVRVPAVVLEIVAGIVVGPSVLGWVEVDQPVEVLALVGLAFLLFLAGLEIELHKLRGRVLRVALAGFGVSFTLAVLVGLGLDAAGIAGRPLFIAILLSATSLGVIVPVLKDGGEAGTPFGQLVIAAASIADFATVILLSLLFSREATGTATKVLLLTGLVLASVLVVLAIAEVDHSRRLRATLRRLQDTTAQIRVRGAFLLLIGLTALAASLGLEVILGAFIAGAVLTMVDRDETMTHPDLREKLDAIGFGVFIPVFFVTSGLRFDANALTDASTLALVPLFLAALMLVRGLPALLYRSLLPPRRVIAAGLMQATSLPFIVAATAIGRELHVVGAANQAALIAAGLVSVVLFPAAGASLLGMRARPAIVPQPKGAMP